MLAKMEANDQVDHRSEGRSNIYRPLIQRHEVSQTMISDLAERLFQGNVSELMCSLLDGCEVSSDELSRLKKLIRDKEKELRNG
jgi:predicted transcriptional regulator